MLRLNFTQFICPWSNVAVLFLPGTLATRRVHAFLTSDRTLYSYFVVVCKTIVVDVVVFIIIVVVVIVVVFIVFIIVVVAIVTFIIIIIV
jgi:hypothetical protein